MTSRITTLGLHVESLLTDPQSRITSMGIMVEYLPGRTTLQPTVALYSFGLSEYGDYDVPELVDLAMVSGDKIYYNQVALTGSELIIAHNTDLIDSHWIHIESAKDPYQRYKDIDYEIEPGRYAAFGPFELDGWVQPDGKLYINADHFYIHLGCVRLVLG